MLFTSILDDVNNKIGNLNIHIAQVNLSTTRKKKTVRYARLLHIKLILDDIHRNLYTVLYM